MFIEKGSIPFEAKRYTMKPLTFAGLSLLLVACARAGEVCGTVRLKSTVQDSLECGSRFVLREDRYRSTYREKLGTQAYTQALADDKQGPKADAFKDEDKVSLTVIEVLGVNQAPRPWKQFTHKNTMDQKDKAFRPRVVAIPAGSRVRFNNTDTFSHHIYAPNHQVFDEIVNHQPRQPLSREFPKPGIYRLFCGIHPRMSAWVYVASSNYLAQPDSAHNYRIPDVPAGKYRLRIWHPLLTREPVEKEVVIPAEGKVQFDFEL